MGLHRRGPCRPSIGLYTVAAHSTRRFALVAGLGTAITMAAILAMVSDRGGVTPETYAVLAWFGMAAAIGDATRGRRTLVAAAEERARRAEQSREEEARRRVGRERIRGKDLHDVVAHHIAVINVQAGVADHLMASDPEKARESLRHVRSSTQLVLTEMGHDPGPVASARRGGRNSHRRSCRMPKSWWKPCGKPAWKSLHGDW